MACSPIPILWIYVIETVLGHLVLSSQLADEKVE